MTQAKAAALVHNGADQYRSLLHSSILSSCLPPPHPQVPCGQGWLWVHRTIEPGCFFDLVSLNEVTGFFITLQKF